MSKVTLIGGTGYVGSNVARHAVSRGHEVTVVSRNEPTEKIAGVSYILGSVTDKALVQKVVKNSDVVFASVTPRGDLEQNYVAEMLELAEVCRENGTRFGTAGGAGSLHVSEGGILLMDTEGFPAFIRPGSVILAEVLEQLRKTAHDLDWFVITPAAGFRVGEPGEALGRYRIGGDVLVTDAEGNSFISGSDFGLAVVDEIDNPKHSRARFTVAY
ncbi:MAG: NAD(P)-dependent oxidoreductase [Micrococcales bacterium]